MSQAKNLANVFVPIREARESLTLTSLAVLNSELVHDVSGDESAIVNVVGLSPVMTLAFEGSIDGVVYFPILAQCYYGVGGTVPNAALAMIADTLAATNTLRVYSVRCAQLKKIRVRVSAFTSGAIDVVIRSDAQRSVHPGVNDRTSSPLFATVTAATGVAATLTLPAVAGLRHHLDFIKIVRSPTALLTAAAAPVVVTTTNLPGSPAFTFGQDAAAQGVDREVSRDFGGTGLAAVAVGTATTIVCPAYTGVIWRVEASYRLGV